MSAGDRVKARGRYSLPREYAGAPAYRRERSRRAALLVLRRQQRRRGREAIKRGGHGYVRTALMAALSSFGLIVVLTVGALGGGTWAAWQYFTYDLPSLDSVHLSDFQTTRIYDRNGILLYEISDPNLGKRTYVSIDQIPRNLINATIAAEDATFYENRGVDFRSILRAIWINTSGQGSSGASTITMQLVRSTLLPEQDEASLRRKVREAILANQFTNQYSKDKILEIYLNEIYYGSLAYGADAAAEVYYNKPVSDLTLAQAALLAGLPQAPSYYDPYTNFDQAKKRQQYVLDQMVKNSFISQAQADAALAEDVQPVSRPDAPPQLAPHFVNYVRGLLEDMYGADMVNRGGLKVMTTIDLRMQDLAQQVASDQIAALKDENASNAALVALNPRNGEIMAMLGSVDYNNPEFGQYNVAIAPRQPGSSFKPIVYATAFDQGLSPATLLDDIPTQFDTGANQPPYAPKDYDLQYRGPVLVRRALDNSLNIPAVQMIQKVGVGAVLDKARSMGITTLSGDAASYGLPLALGAGDVRLLDLTNVYATFANNGVNIAPVALLDVQDSSGKTLYHYDPQKVKGIQAVSPQAAYLISDILSDNDARTEEFGANSALKLSRKAAAKTGTTEDYKDSLTMGYTPDLAVGAWVGNNDGTPMAQIAGARGAGPIWHNFFEGVFADPTLEQELLQSGETGPPLDFAVPPGIVRQQVCSMKGATQEQAASDMINEVFIAGHVPDQACPWQQTFKVDTSFNPPLLANMACPSSAVADRAYIVLPAQYDAWVKAQQGDWGPPTATAPCAAPTPTITIGPGVRPTEPPSLITTTIATTIPAAPFGTPQKTTPGLSLTSPTNNAIFQQGQIVPLAANASGPAGVLGVEFYVDGLRVASDNSAPYVYNWPATPGAHTISAVTYSPDGTPAYSGQISITVNASSTPAPIITPFFNIVSPQNNAATQDKTLPLVAQTDNSIIARVDFQVDGKTVGTIWGASVFAFSWQTTPGQHALLTIGYDKTGQEQGRASSFITVNP